MRENAIIPIVPTSFIGRRREIDELTRLLASSSLVTLTGAAGCGKTRLALRAAQEINGRYPDGIHWLELAPLTDATLLPQTIAKGLHLKEQAERPLLQTIIDALKERNSLLILDNCEHLRTACTELVTTLLAKTSVSILTTSREPLRVTGEKIYPIPPLSLPPRPLSLDAGADASQFDAIQLFAERARAILPQFALTADNGDIVANICHQLDGLPLAIEMAAARVNVLTVTQIANRLDNHFALLAPTAHINSPHQTLRAAIDWSYDLLAEPEQLLLRRLSVFAGGCSLSEAETVCVGDGVEREQVLDLLASLVNKSLVTAVTLQRSQARYILLETIHQYGQEKLQETDEWSRLHERHLDRFLQLAEETEPKLRGEYQQLWLNWLEDEHDNIRAALRWSLKSDQIEQGLRIAIALYQFWTIRDYTGEGLAWIEQLLAQADESIPPVVRANALAYATFLAGFRGNSTTQAAYGREAAGLAEALGDEGQSALAWAKAGQAYTNRRPGPLPIGGSPLAWALGAQAYDARAKGDYETELAIYKKIIQLHRETGERYFLGISLITASFAEMSLGKYEEARAMVDEGLPLLRKVKNAYWIAMTLNGSGDLARCEKNYTRAQADYEESIALLREICAIRDLASSLHNLGYTCLHLANVERAHALFSESMVLQHTLQNTSGIAECLMGFAAMAVVCGMPIDGVRLLAAAVAIGGEGTATTWAATKMEYEHYLALTRASLTEQEFQAEQTAGRILSLEQAVAYAQNLPLNAAAQKIQKNPDDLTPREREVATLVAQTKSNEEIAVELVLSKRTVEKHISNIRSKLRFTKRAQIVHWVIENELVDSAE